MSWEAWAQLILADNKGKANAGGLLCDTNGNVWATSGTLNNAGKVSQMAGMCKNVFANGVGAQGSFYFPDEGCPGSQRYMVLRCEDNRIMAKKGQAGLSIVQYKNEGYIVGAYDETMQPGSSCNRVCEVLDLLVNPSK